MCQHQWDTKRTCNFFFFFFFFFTIESICEVAQFLVGSRASVHGLDVDRVQLERSVAVLDDFGLLTEVGKASSAVGVKDGIGFEKNGLRVESDRVFVLFAREQRVALGLEGLRCLGAFLQPKPCVSRRGHKYSRIHGRYLGRESSNSLLGHGLVFVGLRSSCRSSFLLGFLLG